MIPSSVARSTYGVIQTTKSVSWYRPLYRSLAGNMELGKKLGKVYINNAQVIMADVKAKNGIVHVIDSVLLP